MFLLALIGIVAQGVLGLDNEALHFESSKLEWDDFKIVYNKRYGIIEETKRYEIFIENMKKIEMHNNLYAKGLKSYKLGINEYADLDHDEFVRIMNGFNPGKQHMKRNNDALDYLPLSGNLIIPDKVDWRTKGYVTPIKNQGACGSCWAFSSTGSLEGQHFRKTGQLVSLSEQNLIDCTVKYGNNGCNGGWMDNAFRYVQDNDGIDTERTYPYLTMQERQCYFTTAGIGATCKNHVDIPTGDENALKESVASVGPVSVAIDANHPSFRFFKSGIYDEVKCHNNITSLDHAVLVVGYGSMQGQDYWLVKNSWGTSWGMEGYIYMSRNKNNQCGIATAASYPLV